MLLSFKSVTDELRLPQNGRWRSALNKSKKHQQAEIGDEGLTGGGGYG